MTYEEYLDEIATLLTEIYMLDDDVAIGIGAPALGGVLIAVNSAASAVGGLAYGGIGRALPLERQLPRMLALLALPVALHAVVASPWLLALPAIVVGLLIGRR